MSKVCETWSLEDLCEMDEEDMEVLLGFYKLGNVPSYQEVRLSEPDGAFDGSFGWL
jgi:precorrin-2 dehydrogenase/sirohydrochlorin ferrochelatase